MLSASDLIGFVATVDLPRAKEFYTRTLGLTVVDESPFACVLDANGTMLRLTPVADLTPAPYTVLGWRVADIASTTTELLARGVTFTRYDGMEQDESGIWLSPSGARIAWFTDSDGNTLSLTQFPGQSP